MHRQIMGAEYGDKNLVDHEDHNGLNNQKYNLRVCSRAQNNMNANKRKNATSIYKGVSYEAVCRARKKWVSQIYANRKQYYLGKFLTEIEAAEAYDKKAVEVHGEFAVLNFNKNSTQ